MEKRMFYVSVTKSEILADPEAINYEFIITATDTEIDQLQELFVDASSAELNTTSRVATPFETYPEPNQDEKESAYDLKLKAIYQMLHRLGTPETREHIESMKVLEGSGL